MNGWLPTSGDCARLARRIRDSYREKSAGPTEERVEVRVAVLASVLIAVVAVGVESAAATGDVVAALVLLPIGAVVSYRRRDAANTVVKLLLTVGAIAVMYRFFGQLQTVTSLDDTRVPLANLFLAVQILHGFDLPRRRDLGFTLASSLALVALAGAAARGMGFAWLLAGYVACAAWAATGLQRSAATEAARHARSNRLAAPSTGADGPTSAGLSHLTASAATLARALAPALAVGLAVFLVLPRADGVRLGGLPFQGLGSGDQQVGSGRVVNPGLPYGGGHGGDGGGQSFTPDAYFGLAEHVDLRTRGRLSQELVMRVRTTQPSLWRGMVFDRYGESGWSRSAEQPDQRDGIPVRLEPPFDPTSPAATTARSSARNRHGRSEAARYRRVTQTFELATATPNLIFAAAEPVEVHHAAGSVGQWADGTLTTSATQDAGTVYSVVSAVDTAPPTVLRGAAGRVPDEVAATYTQVPEDMPGRVTDLGRRLTGQAATPYGKAEEVQGWLRDNVEYSLDPTRQPPNSDAVDWFLFEHRVGWCEQIASSMVLLLRSGGVPARFATGFAPGTRNPFTGWYEVRMSDAHAWVEVWVPDHGWVAFDPTGEVPLATGGGGGSGMALFDLGGWVADRIPAGLTESVRTAARSTMAAVGSLDWTRTGGLLTGLAALAGALVAWRRRRRRPAPSATHPPSPFAQLERLLADDGVDRDVWQTPREYVARVRLHRPEIPDGPLEGLLADEEHRRYATVASDEAPTRTSPVQGRSRGGSGGGGVDDGDGARQLAAVAAALDERNRTTGSHRTSSSEMFVRRRPKS